MKHKNYSLREMLFDKCLQNGRAMTGREMMDYANRYLEFYEYHRLDGG